MDELIKLIDINILNYDEKISKISKKIRNSSDIYKMFSGKREDAKTEVLFKVAKDQNLSKKLYDVVVSSNVIMIKMLQDFIEKRNKLISEFKDQNDERLNFEFSVLLEKEKALSIKKEAEELKDYVYNMAMYICDYVIDTYNNLLKEKEDLKKLKKGLEYAKKKILKKEKLNTIDIFNLNTIIDEISDVNIKRKLYDFLNEYISSFIKVTKEEIIVKAPIIYKDEDIKQEEVIYKEEEKDLLIKNYLFALRSFDNEASINMFLESIKESFDIKIFIEKIFKYLTNSNKDELIKKCLLSLDINEENEEKVSKDNKLYYYGFNSGKNKILQDIKEIPKNLYSDIQKGLLMIKEDGAYDKAKGIMKVKKVLKLRISDIRIAYRRLDNNTYLIIGIYKKENNKGSEIIDSIINRNNSFTRHNISELLQNKKIKDEYDVENEIYDNEIFSLLNNKKLVK